MSSSRFAVFAVTFAAVFAAVYYFAVDYNWALFSYAPAARRMDFAHPYGGRRPDDVLVRLDRDLGDRRLRWPVLSFAGFPGNPGKRLWSGLAWLVPICSIAAIAHLLSGYFTR